MSQPPEQTNLPDQSFAAAEERFRALVIASTDIIYSLNADWTIMRELDGRGFLKDTHAPMTNWKTQNVYPDDMAIVNNAIDEAIREKKIFQLEHRVLRADGTPGWTFSRAVPILDHIGDIIEWFGAASDITERKLSEAALQKSRENAEHQKRVYETITSNTPDLMYVFSLDYRFTYANSALLSMWGKTWHTAIGKGLRENGYEEWHAAMHEREIDQVVATKEPVRGEVSFPHATLGKRVYHYIFTPVLNDHGEVEAVAGTTRDITERKQWEEKLALSTEELQAINEEMAATNEEQAASNEELTATNEELLRMQQTLRELTDEKQAAIEQMRANDQNFRNMVRQAPVGMCIVEGDPLYMVAINDAFLEIIGKTREEIKKPYWDVVPEAEAYYRPITENVFATGETFHANEHEIMLIRNGKDEIVHIDFVYEPMKDSSGKTYAIMIVAIDITDKVLARRKVERAEESLRMAVDTAGLGTYHINATDRIFHSSPRLKEFFGFLPDEEVPYDAAINQIHPDYRQQAAEMVEAAFTKGERFDLEYPVIGHHDSKIRWVRGIGEMQHYDGKDFFTGVLHEITEKKQDEIRKNDFIGMVSHELKTPLTSLTAIVQVLQAKLKKNEDPFVPGALEKASTQVKKMSTMINGFLNISRLESGKIVIDKQAFIISDLVKEIIEETVLTGITHNIGLRTCDKMLLQADRDKIGSVISNLLSNAVKYSPKGSQITVDCQQFEDQAVVSVADEGLGIRPEDLDKIFDRYYRVQTNHTQHISGFGIGLYLSAEIIQRHNGKIWAESEAGKGSEFHFSLPLKEMNA